MHELVLLDLSQITVRAGLEIISSGVLAIIIGVRVLGFYMQDRQRFVS